MGEGGEAYLGDDRLDELGQVRVHVVHDDADALGLAGVQGPRHVARHVLLQHGLDVAPLALVGREDGLAAQQAALLGAVPVELEGVVVVAVDEVLGLQEDAEGLEDGHGAAAVVVSARGGQHARQPQVDRVLVCADDDGRVGLARDGGDDAVLTPGVLEVLGADVALGAGVLDGLEHLLEKPLAGLPAVVGLRWPVSILLGKGGGLVWSTL